MTAMRVLLVDDEPLALKGLRLRLAALEDIEIVGACANGREAIRTIRECRPDLVFLDIQMPGLDGFDVVRALLGTPEVPLVVFVTAYDEYAVAAFEAHALDYLLKPVDESRLAATAHTARERLAERRAREQTARIAAMIEDMRGPETAAISAILQEAGTSQETGFARRLHIKDRGRIAIVEVDDVDYIDAAGDYLCIHVGEVTHILRDTMKAMERRLDPARFGRIHRSAIVNLGRIAEMRPHANGECFVTLHSGQTLKVSRSYRSVMARFL